jgi:ADP-ribosylglycohydrolase
VRTRDFLRNSWVVDTFQVARCAIHDETDGATSTERVCEALEQAVRAGNDTDTVAAISDVSVGGL